MNRDHQTVIGMLSQRDLAWCGLFLAVFLFTYSPVVQSLYKAWMDSDDNSHGFLIVPLAIYMVWTKKEVLKAVPVRGEWIGLIVLLVSLMLYVVGWYGGVKTLSYLAFLGAFVGGLWLLLGWSVVWANIFPLAFLIFMVPVPAQIYAVITGPLQVLVSQVAGKLLFWSSVPTYVEGAVIYHPQQVFEVVQACSGLRSIMTMLTLGAAIGFFMLRSRIFRGLLLISGVPIAILVNIFRVYVLVFAFDKWGWDLTVGTPHTVLGLGVFALALLLFFGLLKGMARWDR